MSLKNWWKISLVVLIALVARVLMLQFLPLSPTFELPLSVISQAIGMIPTAASVITVSYLVIAVVILHVQNGVAGSRMVKAITCALAFGILWFVGVLETIPALGKPLMPELMVGLADIVPVLLLGILTSAWTSSNIHNRQTRSLIQSISGLILVALMYFVGRYFLYTVIHVNSGYFTREKATFGWTLAMGLAIGLMYILLRGRLKGKVPWQRGLWFAMVVFGIVWMLSNFFMPIVFEMSFISFQPPILNYVWRVVVDILAVAIGVWIAEGRMVNEQSSAG